MFENRQIAVFEGKCCRFRNSSECLDTHCAANDWPILMQKVRSVKRWSTNFCKSFSKNILYAAVKNSFSTYVDGFSLVESVCKKCQLIFRWWKLRVYTPVFKVGDAIIPQVWSSNQSQSLFVRNMIRDLAFFSSLTKSIIYFNSESPFLFLV